MDKVQLRAAHNIESVRDNENESMTLSAIAPELLTRHKNIF